MGIAHRQILPSFPTRAGFAATALTAPDMVYMLRQVATMKNAASTNTTMLLRPTFFTSQSMAAYRNAAQMARTLS
jgi:hypothetical protein